MNFPNIDLTPAVISAAAAGLISVILSYFPGLNIKWDRLDPTIKRLAFAGALVVVTAVIVGLSCASIIGAVTCDKQGIIEAVIVLGSALWTSQSVFALSPTAKAVVEDRNSRLGQG